MPEISKDSLVTAMSKSGVTTKHLADETKISLQYACDIVAGRRKLTRNPVLRKRIAEVCDVPQHWIETRPEVSA